MRCLRRASGVLNKVHKNRKSSFQLFLGIFFLVIVGLSAAFAEIPLLIFGVYLAVSVVTYFIYAFDKASAIKQRWRISEKTLHLFSLAGGWPGAIIAQQKLRHKTQKQPFRFIFWITVLLNCTLFFWMFTPKGAYIVSSLINRIGLTGI